MREEAEHDFELLQHCLRGLGCLLEDVDTGATQYQRSDDCVDCLKDIQQFLRDDDPVKRPAFFEIQDYDTATNDLVPLLHAYRTDKELVLNVVKLATRLSMPVDKESEAVNKQVEKLQQLKRAFLKKGTLSIAALVLLGPLGEMAYLTETDVLVVELVLAFLRNLLSIPDPLNPGGTVEGKGKLHAELVANILDNHIMDLLVALAQRVKQARLRSVAPLLLEVMSGIFSGLTAKQLIKARESGQNIGSSQPLANGPLAQPSSRPQQMIGFGNSTGRPPARREIRPLFRFADPNSRGRARVTHDPCNAMRLPQMPCHKNRTKRMVAEEVESNLPLRLVARLQDHMDRFLEHGYGPLMETVLKKLEPGLGVSRLEKDDFLRFVQLARLCTGLTFRQQEKLLKDETRATANQQTEARQEDPGMLSFASISATMGWETFHLVQSLWCASLDLPSSSTEKSWALQHTSLSLLKEMLLVLDLAHQAGSPSDRNAADRLIRRILHDDQKESGLLPVLGDMLKKFSFLYQPRSHAAEVVEAIHITLRLYQRLSSEEGAEFMVKRQAAQRRRSTKAAPESVDKGEAAEVDEPPADAEQDAAAAKENEPEVGNDKDNEPETANKENAPEVNSDKESQPEAAAGKENEPEAGSDKESGGKIGQPQTDYFAEMEEEEAEQKRLTATKEVAYNMNQRVRQVLAHPSVIHIYTWLLRGYKTNSDLLNHSIASFLKRIASPQALNLEPMLYQVSVMRILQQILSDKEFRAEPRAAELLRLSQKIAQGLFAWLVPPDAPLETRPAAGEDAAAGEKGEASSRAPCLTAQQQAIQDVKAKLPSMIFVELLFWKDQRVAEELQMEYGWEHLAKRSERHVENPAAGDSPVQVARPALSAVHKNQLIELFEQHGMEKGYLDAITEKFEEGWPRGKIARTLKSLNLKRGQLTENQRSHLTRLFEEHRNTKGRLKLIANGMPGNFQPSQIAAHIRKLGLYQTKERRHSSQKLSGSSLHSNSEKSEDDGGSGRDEPTSKQKPAARKRRSAADWSDEDSDVENQPRKPTKRLSQNLGLESGDESDVAEEGPHGKEGGPRDQELSPIAAPRDDDEDSASGNDQTPSDLGRAKVPRSSGKGESAKAKRHALSSDAPGDGEDVPMRMPADEEDLREKSPDVLPLKSQRRRLTKRTTAEFKMEDF